MSNKLSTVTKENPCRHCGKTDWCYRIGDLEVCNRGQIADGWVQTSKTDKNGLHFLAEEKKQERKKEKKIVKSRHTHYYPTRNGEPLIKVDVIRYENAKKQIYQSHWNGSKWEKTRGNVQREDIPIYKYKEVQEAIKEGKTIYVVEGEQIVDTFWELGLAATCNIGGSGKGNFTESDCLDLTNAKLVICPDCDAPGMKHATRIYERFPCAKWLYAFPEHRNWSFTYLPPSEGFDAYDWIEYEKLTASDISDSVEICRKDLLFQSAPEVTLPADLNYTEEALADLYASKPHIAYGDNLYAWTGTHYKLLSPNKERRRIADWCIDKEDKNLTTKSKIMNIWDWVLTRFGVDPDEVNPSGLNLKNGILQLKWEGKKVSWELSPHNPDLYFTYCVDVDYKPNADRSECERFLEILEPGQRLIFLRTIAASIDLDKVRKFRGRSVKCLLLQGEGSNGKDSLRELCYLIFGERMVSVSIGAFKSYDSNHKFPLAKLHGASISWSSENTQFASLDNIQSLKQAVTGDPIDIEFKHQNEFSINPRAVFLFNCNNPPMLTGGSKAIESRYGILTFSKTFSENKVLQPGELRADPRFRYDPEFLRNEIAPAFLNMILEQLPLLISEGIDYSPTREAIKSLQEESNHLWAFCRDNGIEANPEGKLYIKDLWQLLRQWYVGNGTLEVDEGAKALWHDQPNPRDKNVKGANQIFKRFSELFPKIKKMRETLNQELIGQFYLSGISKTASSASYNGIKGVTASYLLHVNELHEANNEAVTTQHRDYEAHEAVEPNFMKTINFSDLAEIFIARLSESTPELKQKLIKELQNVEEENQDTLVQSKTIDYESLPWEFLSTPIPVEPSDHCGSNWGVLTKAVNLIQLTEPLDGHILVSADNWVTGLKTIKIDHIKQKHHV